VNFGYRRNVAVIGSLLLFCSLGFGAWEQVTSGTKAELLAVHFPEGTQVGYAVGTDTTGGGAIFKTTDGGNTWVPQTSGQMNGVYDVYFLDDSRGFAVSGGTLLKTTDGGTTWTPSSPPGMQRLNTVQFPENGQVGYMVATPQGGRGRLLKTTDGGDNWTAITVGGLLNTSLGGGFATDSIGVVVGPGGFIVGTTDGFDSTQQYQGPRTAADLIAVAFSREDATKGYLIGNDTLQGVVRYTADDGASLWDIVRCPVITAFYGVDMPTADVAYVCGTGGFIGRTVSATDVWATTVPTGLTAVMRDVCFPNGADTGYAVGSGGTILRTYDSGMPWIPAVTEGKAPAVLRDEIRVVSNPSRRGITFQAETDVKVVVFDTAGRVVTSRAASKGLNFLPLPEAGVYLVKVTSGGFSTTRKLVVEH